MTDLATVAEPGDHTARLAAAFTATRRTRTVEGESTP